LIIKSRNRFSFENIFSRNSLNLILIIFLVFSSFSFGYLYHRSGYNLKTAVSLVRSPVKTSLNYLRSSFLVDRKNISININFRNYEKLRLKRKIAIENGYLKSSDKDWVPGKINYNEKTINVDLRLKGILFDHWEHDNNWSYRIKVKGDETLFGMKKFSIQHPRTRGYLDEYIFHQLLKYTGLISLRYDFISVQINGVDQSIYALEENFDKILIENNNRREGPILRFDPDIFVHNTHQGIEPSIFFGTAIIPYNEKKYYSDPNFKGLFDFARTQLEKFRQGQLKTSEVFDIEKLSKFLAILDLIGNPHAGHLANLRFYFNPITQLIEPVGYDNGKIYLMSQVSKNKLLGENRRIKVSEKSTYKSNWLDSVFGDEIFFEKYIQALNEISNNSFLNNFFIKNDDLIKDHLNKLHKSYPWYNFSNQILYKNQDFIKEVLNPEKNLHVYLKKINEKDNIHHLSIQNIHSFPKEIIGIEVNGGSKSFFGNSRIIQPRLVDNNLDDHILEIPILKDFNQSSFSNANIIYRQIGNKTSEKERIYPWQKTVDDLNNIYLADKKLESLRKNFISVNDTLRTIHIKRGSWEVSNSIIIPKGYSVFMYDSTNINLINGSKILSFSPIFFIGTPENPIYFYSKDRSGQGLVIINANKTSRLENVVFQYLSNPKGLRDMNLTGSVTFYQSPVKLTNSIFSNNNSEDALNIISSKFEIDNVRFENIKFDAFDGDFVNGTLANSMFFNCNNDAIDFSGSVVNIKNIKINVVGDKAISIGENSSVKLNNIEIINAKIGIASKDLSKIIAKKINIRDSEIGLTAYKKKAQFGPGEITIDDYSHNHLKNNYLLENESVIHINGLKQKTNSVDLYNYFYANEK